MVLGTRELSEGQANEAFTLHVGKRGEERRGGYLRAKQHSQQKAFHRLSKSLTTHRPTATGPRYA